MCACHLALECDGYLYRVLVQFGCCSSFAKKRPPSDTQIRKHREQLRQYTQWKDDVTRINTIVGKLGNAYQEHRGDFALGRYEEIKQMIKNAIKEYQELMQKTQKHAKDGATSAMADRYSGNNNSSNAPAAAAAPELPPEEESVMGALFTKLKKKAVEMGISSAPPPPSPPPAQSNKRMSKDDVKDKEMDTWGYEGRKSKELIEETESMRKDVVQFKADFRLQRDRLERLAKEYEDSKKHTPPQRYTVMKFMIKDAVGA